MAVVGDNRGVRDRPVAQRPDGSWSFEDARRRRDQRQSAGTALTPPTTGDPEEDLSALALSLADNLTIDGTPLSELEAHQRRDGSDALGLPADNAPTAEEIMRALETEQHAAARSSTNSAQAPQWVHLAPQPSTRRRGHGRWLRGAPFWAIACIVSAGVVAALVVQLASSTGTTAPRRPGHTLATDTAATAASLSAATARFLAVEHAADRNLGPARSQRTRAARLSHHRQPSLHTPAHRGSPSSSTTTSSTSGTAEAVDTTQQPGPSSSNPSSGSASSGSGQASPATQPHTSPSSNSGSSSSTPSKATLRSLVTGAGTCSCQ
jgi:hypothetical protein